MNYYITACEEMLEVHEQECTSKSILEMNRLARMLIRFIENNITAHAWLPHHGNAAYGLRDNPYSSIISDLQYNKSMLESYVLNAEKLVELALNDTAHVYNRSMFHMDNNGYNRVAQECKSCFELIGQAVDNKLEMHKLALRFEEGDCSKMTRNGEAFMFLDLKKMQETEYAFSKWQLYYSVNKVTKYDGEKWPILKQIHAELYI